jgi:hypothetical protein
VTIHFPSTLSVNLAKANSRAPPHIQLSSVSASSANMAEAVGEGYVITRSDGEISNLIVDQAFE